MVLGVGLQVVNVDIGEAGQQQLQFLLVEDSDQSKNVIFGENKFDLTIFWLPSGNNVIESLKEGRQLFPDRSSHLHLTHELDVVLLVLIGHLDIKQCGHWSLKRE